MRTAFDIFAATVIRLSQIILCGYLTILFYGSFFLMEERVLWLGVPSLVGASILLKQLMRKLISSDFMQRFDAPSRILDGLLIAVMAGYGLTAMQLYQKGDLGYALIMAHIAASLGLALLLDEETQRVPLRFHAATTRLFIVSAERLVLLTYAALSFSALSVTAPDARFPLIETLPACFGFLLSFHAVLFRSHTHFLCCVAPKPR